jgi:hypothetical protein
MRNFRTTALDRLHGNPVLQRRAFLLTTWAAVAAVMVITAVLTDHALTAKVDLGDRLAEASAVFAGATVLLAAIAAGVALLAYTVSTGLLISCSR